MTVRYILGRAGSGKSEFCIEAIRRKLSEGESGPPLILLVPEQSTFQAEHKLVTAPGLRGFIRAQVLSFRRLAFRVMQETGGTARVHINENGKRMLLHKLIHKLQDELKAFRSAAGEPGFIGKVAEMISELKRYRIDAETLKTLLEQDGAAAGAGPLADKLSDIAAVYAAFEQAMSGLYVDTEDNLAWLADKLGESSYAGAEVWIDGFNGFTPQELAVVGAIMRHSRSVSVALCVDRLYELGEEPDEWSLFHPTATTLLQIRQLAAEYGIAEAPPVLLPGGGPTRYDGSPMLAALERMWTETPRPQGEIRYMREDIRLSAAAHRRAEAEAAALRMLELVRDEGYRWRDMAVFVRNLADYRDVLAAALADYGIPHFFDQKRTVNHHPLIELIRGAMDTVRSGWRYDAVFRAVKTGLLLGPCASKAEETERRMAMDRLENYVLAFGIHGARWKDERPWRMVPRDSLEESEEARSERHRLLLEDVNASRERVAAPLIAFERDVKRAETARELAAAVFALLERTGAAAQLEAWADDCLQRGEVEAAREHAGIWGSVIDVLDQLTEMIGDEGIRFEAFADLLDTGLEEIKLGLVPPTLDQVLIGSMDRSRPGTVKHAFILGASDGVLPSVPPEDGLLTETERRTLSAGGIRLAPDSRRRLLDEQFMIYMALALPSHSLWISYPLADDEGRALPPSEVIGRIHRLFPQLKVAHVQSEAPEGADEALALEFVSGRERTLSRLVAQLRQARRGTAMAEVWWAAYNWFCAEPAWRDALKRRMQSLFYRNSEEPLQAETSRLLYGLPFKASVSRMELFAACRFAHFAGYGLRLRERRVYRLEAPDIGQLFHAALSMIGGSLMKEGLPWSALTPQQCAERASAAVDALSPRLQSEILDSSGRYRHVAMKLKQVVGKAAAVLAEQSRVGHFRTAGLELGFGPGQPLPPLRMPLSGGGEMEIIGRIDRIDRADGENGTWLRVIDYKSSGMALDLAKVYYGLSLQMLTYLDVAVTHAQRWLGVKAKPGGMLYFHVHQPLLRSGAKLSEEEAEAEILKRYRTKGLVMADEEAIRLLDSTIEGGGRSVFFPVAIKKDGGFHRNASVMTEEQWHKLRRHGRRKIREIGQSIVQGKVDIAPYRIGQQTPCAYCSYKPVCQFDAEVDGNGYNRLIPYTADEIWQRFEREGEA